MVYPLIWHFAAAGPASPSGAAVLKSAKAGPTSRVAPRWPGESRPEESRATESEASERRVVSRTMTERLPAPVTTKLEPVPAPELPHEPSVDDPQVPLPVMPELKEVLARVAEVQQHAHDPAELDHQVQTLDADPAKLARLKALADMFIKLPTPRSDDYLPSSSGAEPHPTAR